MVIWCCLSADSLRKQVTSCGEMKPRENWIIIHTLCRPPHSPNLPHSVRCFQMHNITSGFFLLHRLWVRPVAVLPGGSIYPNTTQAGGKLRLWKWVWCWEGVSLKSLPPRPLCLCDLTPVSVAEPLPCASLGRADPEMGLKDSPAPCPQVEGLRAEDQPWPAPPISSTSDPLSPAQHSSLWAGA